ncbi:MAG: hypothetical protein R3314_08290 [Longimicrobiales bacterium]|nr:hypothetical protein [Longimicrobiales bacterium]
MPSLVAACAARSAPSEPVELDGSYLIEGMVGGRMLRGTLSFPVDGGYVFVTNAAVCDETDRDGVRELGRQLRRADDLVVRCGGFEVEIDFADGDLAETGLANRVQSRSHTVATTCAQYDENNNCIRYNASTRTSSRRHDGVVTVKPIGDG